MKVIIAGSRNYRGGAEGVHVAVKESGFDVITVISGVARGADLAGENWARAKGVQVERFPADWKKHGRSAGIIRNCQMAEAANALIALWDGSSRGTLHMISKMKLDGKPVFVYWDKKWFEALTESFE